MPDSLVGAWLLQSAYGSWSDRSRPRGHPPVHSVYDDSARLAVPSRGGCSGPTVPMRWRGVPPIQLAVGHPTSADCWCRRDVDCRDLWRLTAGSIAGVSVPVWRPTSQDGDTGSTAVCRCHSDGVPSRLWVTAVLTGTVTGVSILVQWRSPVAVSSRVVFW